MGLPKFRSMRERSFFQRDVDRATTTNNDSGNDVLTCKIKQRSATVKGSALTTEGASRWERHRSLRLLRNLSLRARVKAHAHDDQDEDKINHENASQEEEDDEEDHLLNDFPEPHPNWSNMSSKERQQFFLNELFHVSQQHVNQTDLRQQRLSTAAGAPSFWFGGEAGDGNSTVTSLASRPMRSMPTDPQTQHPSTTMASSSPPSSLMLLLSSSDRRAAAPTTTTPPTITTTGPPPSSDPDGQLPEPLEFLFYGCIPNLCGVRAATTSASNSNNRNNDQTNNNKKMSGVEDADRDDDDTDDTDIEDPHQRQPSSVDWDPTNVQLSRWSKLSSSPSSSSSPTHVTNAGAPSSQMIYVNSKGTAIELQPDPAALARNEAIKDTTFNRRVSQKLSLSWKRLNGFKAKTVQL